MDQKRLLLAIAISLAILIGYNWLIGPYLPKPPAHQTAQTEQNAPKPSTTPNEGSPASGAPPQQTAAVPKNVPRVKIAAPRVEGSISLLGGRIDDLTLTDYRETLAPDSPHVRLLEPKSDPHPYYAQFGWAAGSGDTVKLPNNDTVWTASADTLTAKQPVTLSWDNGEGLTFLVTLSVDDHYMFNIRQSVKNSTGQPVKLFPWSRIRREYLPEVSGYTVLFEGLLGAIDGKVTETSYSSAKSEGEKHNGIAYDATTTGGWAGITDKYWLTSLIPDQAVPSKVNFRFNEVKPGNIEQFQVDFVSQEAQTVPPGGEAAMESHLFAGAKVVNILSGYEKQLHIKLFDYAVDWGWFWFLTRPIFLALDYLNALLGNFGVAILVFTVFVKALFFPLANYSYRSMSKMKLLAPKMTALRERFKDEPQRLQQEMMGLYRAEKVNPASGCLPMLLQIPVFFSLYKVIFVTIEMRQAPFFGWIHDLSQVDPTNVFNLFGLIPFNPAQYLPLLHLGLWPLIMGGTMWLQQKMNPPPPDPVQARMFQFMPIIFTFMLANFPAGLVIYWTWNNLLSVGQQWLIMKRTHLARPGLART